MKNALMLALCGALALSAAEETIRPLHYLSTDKPYYRPGETVYIRDVVLDGLSNCPLKESGLYRYDLVIEGPKGDEVARRPAQLRSSSAGLSWSVPKDAAGGVYTVKVKCDDGGAPAERKFEVLSYRVPRIKSQIEFLRRGYLPGETCAAVITMERAEGGIPTGAVVTAMAMVDGEVVYESEPLPLTEGTARAEFALPKEIAEGDGVLSFSIRDGGVVEGASKSIPILVDNYTVDFYPEGGDLIAGAPNRLYVEAVQRNGKGADIAGKIVRKADGQAVAEFATVLDGRGHVTVTPAEGEELVLVVVNAATGATREFPLPKAVSGVGFTVADDVPPAAGEPLKFKLLRTPGSKLAPAYAVLLKRDKELDKVKLAADATEFSLKPGAYEGVLTVTLYSADRPLAERLVFARPASQLSIEVEPLEESATVPGGKVRLRVTTKDGNGKPVGATVGLTVTDESVLKMVDRREWAPRLREMVYLEGEVRSFADADRYFGDAENGWRYIDLLLGTQGWRRFVPQRRAEIEALYPELLKRILAPAVKLHPEVLYKTTAAGGARRNLVRFAMRDEAVAGDAVGFDMEDGMAVAEEEVLEANMAVMAAPMAAAAAPKENAMLNVEAPAEMEAGGALADVAYADAKPVEAARELPAPVIARQKARVRPPQGQVAWVREYAHKAAADRKPGDRKDFTETVYWSAGLDTDPKTGVAEVDFDLSDNVGTFAVMADGFAADGALGEGDLKLVSAPAFYAEVKVPPFMTLGDTVELPLVLVNNGAEALEGVNCIVEVGDALEVVEAPAVSGALKAGERRRVVAKLRVKGTGAADIAFNAVAGPFGDKVTRRTQVVSPYFPAEFNAGGRVDSATPLALDFEMGEATVNGTQHAAVQLYLSPEANLEDALNALLRQPHGCFEQTSSTNYPLVMAQQYFLSHSGVDSAKISQAQSLLEEGYKKLVSFECKNRGYEWFGADPGHEALTAYGLMEFADMAKVMPVDAAMMANTRQWLLARRDGQGGFQRNERALDSFGRAPKDTTNAYILWSLLESGEKPESLETEIQAVLKKAQEAEDAYLAGLGANIAWLAGRKDVAAALGRKLVQWQQKDGSLDKAGETITCSGGISRQLECAALAALAWVRLGDDFVAATEATMNYLATCCKEGKFGSTQSTVLVLKAINAYDQAFARPLAAGKVELLLDGKPWGEPIAFDKESKGRLEFADCGLRLTPGRHRLEVRMTDGCKLSGSIRVTAMTTLPANAGKLAFSTRLDRDKLAEGEAAQLFVTLKNTAAEAANMPLAVVAIPGGLEVRTAQLRELVDAKRIAAYELWDNAVVLYWRGLNAGQEVTVPVALQAAVPGKWTAAASRAYLYYLDEEKQYVPGTQVEVVGK